MYNEWKNCSVVVASDVVVRGGGGRRGFLQKSGGLLSGRFTQFPFRLLRSEKSPPFSGASPPQMSLSKKHLRMHYGHASPSPNRQLFQNLVFFWNALYHSRLTPYLLLHISNFVYFPHKRNVCYLFLEFDQLSSTDWICTVEKVMLFLTIFQELYFELRSIIIFLTTRSLHITRGHPFACQLWPWASSASDGCLPML